MKLTIASAFLVGSAAAFAPTASFSGRSSSLNMAAGTATEGAKVRKNEGMVKIPILMTAKKVMFVCMCLTISHFLSIIFIDVR
jgi:hypothetical protein